MLTKQLIQKEFTQKRHLRYIYITNLNVLYSNHYFCFVKIAFTIIGAIQLLYRVTSLKQNKGYAKLITTPRRRFLYFGVIRWCCNFSRGSQIQIKSDSVSRLFHFI